MLLVQDQYVQNSRKIFDSELQLKKDTSKQVFSESTKEIWEIQSGCEEEILTSGNESEGEENILCADPSDLPEEIIESKRQSGFHRKKNVRFEGADFSYVLDTSETSSLDEYLGMDCGYRRSLTLEPEKNHKVRGHFRVPKTKWRTVECSYDKKYGCERRPKSTPERSSGYLESGPCGRRPMGEYNVDRRKEHRCGRSHHGDFEFEDVTCRKSAHRYKLECGDDMSTRQRHGDCCDHYPPDEGRLKKSYVKMKPTHVSLPSHKHGCYTEPEVKNHRMVRLDSHYDPLVCHAGEERYCQLDDYYDHVASKNKKKILEAVQEQQEQLSDSTYQIPCSKYSSHTISEFQGKKSLEKLTNSSQSDWLYCSGQGFVGEKVHESPPRIHKMRSRRTRMNKLKNGWKKAFVQTVRDGSRNERVGVIVMGSKGPEFYSKKPPGSVPFRKSKSFLDGAAKSFEVMTIDCKNVFLSSSEPGPRTNYAINDLVSPEDEAKVEEKIAKFSKNVNNIVKSSEEKFYKALTGSDCSQTKKATEGIFKGAGEGAQQGDKKSEKSSGDVLKGKYQFHLPPFDSLSPRVPKSLRRPEKKINEESKAIADALNKQAKQYRESQSNREEKFLEELKELQETFSPKEVSQEKAEPNLPLWSVSENKGEEKEATEEGNEAGKREEAGKDEMSQTGSAKSNEQISINKQRRKKYYESTTSAKGDNKQEDTPSSQTQPEPLTPKTKRMSKLSQWSGSPKASFEGQPLESEKETHANLIPASFRDLVENGCAISQEESENLQSILNQVAFNAEVCSNDPTSSSSSEVIEALAENKASASPRSSKTPSFLEGPNKNKLTDRPEKDRKEYYHKGEDESCVRKDGDMYQTESASRKSHKKKSQEESKLCRSQNKAREGKSKKKIILENKMRLLREALPSIAAENEAAHLKQLKKYIDRFIDRVEASTSSEFRKRKQSRIKSKDSTSTDSSEVRVDARKILDFVSNPFKKISSDVTINIAKKLTDALVQDKSSRAAKNLSTSTKARKTSEEETEEEGLVPRGASSGSEGYEEPEPMYLKQLKKMRNEHLNNIVLEVRRLSELLRFLDRCNRLHV